MNWFELCIMHAMEDDNFKMVKKETTLLDLIHMIGYDYIHDITPQVGPKFLIRLSEQIKFKLVANDIIEPNTFVEVGIDEDYNVFISFDCEISKESFSLGVHIAPEIFVESQMSSGTTLICSCPRVSFEEAYYGCSDDG